MKQEEGVFAYEGIANFKQMKNEKSFAVLSAVAHPYISTCSLVVGVAVVEGEEFQPHRILRIIKNRFGSANEVAVFEMADEGLREVLNPSMLFLQSHSDVAAGCAISATLEGSRALMVEVQALTNKSYSQSPTRHRSNGTDFERFLLLLAGTFSLVHVSVSLASRSAFFKVFFPFRIL